MSEQKKIDLLIILVVVLIVIVLGVVGYLIVYKVSNDNNNENTNQVEEDSSQNNIDETEEDNQTNIEENDNQNNSENKELTIDEFVSMLNGYWANLESTDNISINFNDNQFILGYFAGEASIKSTVQQLEKINENEYRFTAGSYYVYIDISEINNKIIYVRINDYDTVKYGFVSTDYNEAFNYFFN